MTTTEMLAERPGRAGASRARRGARPALPAETQQNPRKELVRDQLISIAAEVFSAKGYGPTSMSDIATALGLGRSAIYHYFRNKEEILRALLREQTLSPYNAMLAIVEAPDLTPSQKLRRAIVEGIVRRLSGGARFTVLSRLEAEMPRDVEPLYNRVKRQILDFYTRFIADGIATGEFRPVDPTIAAFSVIGMANWTSHWYSPAGAKTPQEIGEIMADIALRGLAADPNARQPPDSLGAAIRTLKDDIEALERLTR